MNLSQLGLHDTLPFWDVTFSNYVRWTVGLSICSEVEYSNVIMTPPNGNYSAGLVPSFHRKGGKCRC